MDNNIYGWQHQKGTTWNEGLTEDQLDDFQDKVGFRFPHVLRQFYKNMNGTDRPGVTIYGQSGLEYTYRPIYFTYPDHLEQIQRLIRAILEVKQLTSARMKEEKIPFLFPIREFYFMAIDYKTNPILYISTFHPKHNPSKTEVYTGFYMDSLQSWLMQDLVIETGYQPDVEEPPTNERKVGFWLD